jgi:glutamate synthase (NADPH/NADH) small chain
VVGEVALEVDLVLIAAGFIGPEVAFMEGVPLTNRGTVSVDTTWMSIPASGEMAPVFAAGDSVRGQSLIVWAIAEGRSAASAVHAYISPEDDRLPSPVTPYSVSWA